MLPEGFHFIKMITFETALKGIKILNSKTTEGKCAAMEITETRKKIMALNLFKNGIGEIV